MPAMWWKAALVVLAIAAAAVPVPPSVIEALYSNRVFPILQPLVTGFSNLVPFALFDVLLAGAVIVLVARIIADVRLKRRAGWGPALGRFVQRLVLVAAGAYLLFLLLWGFNYRRVPMTGKVQFDAARVSPEAARALAQTTVDRVNALYEAAHQEGWLPAGTVDPRLADAFARMRAELAIRGVSRPGRPKRTLLDPYFRRAGVAGMTDPYFLETFVVSDLLPFERPAVIAHEWSHLAGIADEGDANFTAWLTCLRGSPAHQYSGWLFLYDEVAGALPPSALRQVVASLNEGPRADLRAIRDRLQRQINPAISAAGWRVYDSYLKANQVEQGAASYAEVVRLILGTTFEGDWVPRLADVQR